MLNPSCRSRGIEVTPVSEALDSIAGERLRNRIRKHLHAGRRMHALDLRLLAELDSGTLAALIRVLRAVRDNGGSVGLIVNQERFLRILSITALDRVFPIFRDESMAAAMLASADSIPA